MRNCQDYLLIILASLTEGKHDVTDGTEGKHDVTDGASKKGKVRSNFCGTDVRSLLCKSRLLQGWNN
jgi:hypothetical protein